MAKRRPACVGRLFLQLSFAATVMARPNAVRVSVAVYVVRWRSTSATTRATRRDDFVLGLINPTSPLIHAAAPEVKGLVSSRLNVNAQPETKYGV